MRVLWLCNIVLPEYSTEFNLKKNVFGGWISGMLHALEDKPTEIGLVFPIIDPNRMKDGYAFGHQYYSFSVDYNSTDYSSAGEQMTVRFREIISEFKPDIIQIWGTEYIHSYAMILAAQELELLDRTLVYIQGMVSFYAEHYMKGMEELLEEGFSDSRMDEISAGKEAFLKRGICEKKTIRLAKHVIGRTNWDKSCVESINRSARYWHCGEILRDEFYVNRSSWNPDKCESFSIFMTQASYPIKGLHFVIPAIAELIDQYPKLHLYISGKNIWQGDDSYGQLTKEYAERLKVSDHITFLGELAPDEVIDRFQKSQVYIMPSTIENSPNSLSEAMMIGIPVVVSNVGGIPDIIQTSSEGLLYQYDAPYMLAYYLRQVMNGGIDLKALSQNESERAGVFNGAQNVVDEITHIYGELINGND